VHAEIVENVGGIVENVDEMGDGGARISADVAHAGLQQCLGDGENALAVKDVALTQSKGANLLPERALHCFLRRWVLRPIPGTLLYHFQRLASRWYEQAPEARKANFLKGRFTACTHLVVPSFFAVRETRDLRNHAT
jgi:hypothetical protein